MPLASPVTVAERVGGVDVATSPPGLDVIVYKVMGLPPSASGALQLTVAWPCPAMAVTLVGNPGGNGGACAKPNPQVLLGTAPRSRA